MRENFTYGSMRGCWRRSYGADCDTGVTAKAAGQPKPPFLWPPRQRPTLQCVRMEDHERGKAVADGARLLGEVSFRGANQQAAFGMGDHFTEPRGVLRRIQRDDHYAGARRCKKSYAEMVIVRHQQRDAVSRLAARVADELAQGA